MTFSPNSLAGCRAYVRAQGQLSTGPRKHFPFVTLSRETGAGALTVAELVAGILTKAQNDREAPPWTIMDKNLVEKALEDHELPGALKRFMPEDVTPFMTDTVEELLGLHPSSWTLVQHTTETMLRLAHMGNVILVGRAANIITGKIENGVHVRLVAPVEQRERHMEQWMRVSHAEAVDYVKNADRARRRYVQRYFDAAIDDPHQYTMVLNTGRLGFQTTARIISDTVLAHLPTLRRHV